MAGSDKCPELKAPESNRSSSVCGDGKSCQTFVACATQVLIFFILRYMLKSNISSLVHYDLRSSKHYSENTHCWGEVSFYGWSRVSQVWIFFVGQVLSC